MTFQIISAGWSCAQFMERTLRSVEGQWNHDWRIMVVYDGGDNGGEFIQDWCDSRDERWNYKLNDQQLGAVHNQYDGIRLLDPDPEDVIVYLDLDGDQLAHPQVLEHLASYYTDDTMVTYGNYQPIPFAVTCPPATPFPPEVVAARSYRQHVLGAHGCHFNHLRTVKAHVYLSIPEDRFRRTTDNSWFESGTDYITMISSLERADGRYKCLEEILLLYNNANPLADYIVHPEGTTGNIRDALERPPLDPLPR